jgi:lipoate-protein ligase A
VIERTRILTTRTTDPFLNLALEEYLLDHLQPQECILYLWQNQNTVVIGRHQNPWRECKVEELEREGGRLARRISGGGAVFHDLGNLNFTFLLPRADYDLTRQLQVIVGAARQLGIRAEQSGRNDITVDGRKFSGNAFYLRRDRAFHHGTILVSVDMSKLGRYLQVSAEKMRSKGVQSVAARVANLAEFRPGLTTKETSEALKVAFQQTFYPASACEEAETYHDRPEVIALRSKYASWKWRFGQTPPFDVEWQTRFLWGGLDLCLCLDGGRIASATVYSDAMDEQFIADLGCALVDRTYQADDVREAVNQIKVEPESESFRQDVSTWLAEILPP